MNTNSNKPDNNTEIRAFIAIKLPDSVKTQLKQLQVSLKQSGIRASWPKPESMHLTLKFIGKIPLDRLDSLKDCIKKAAQGINAHILYASGIGAFPSLKKPRVIWAGLKGDLEIIEKLVKQIEYFLHKELGIKKEKKRFSPHLTLARIKRPISFSPIIKIVKNMEMDDIASDEFLVSKIILYKSTLLPSGAKHENIFSVPLLKS